MLLNCTLYYVTFLRQPFLHLLHLFKAEAVELSCGLDAEAQAELWPPCRRLTRLADRPAPLGAQQGSHTYRTSRRARAGT
jgi:hypothetical protein